MGTEKLGKILIAGILVIMAFSPLLLNSEADGSETRAPDIYGHITSDTMWSGSKWFDDVIIDPGVTVTVQSNTELKHYNDAYIWVRGTLIVTGTERNPVIFGEDGSITTWEGITVNETGMAIFDNFTIREIGSSSNALNLYGQPCTIRNGMIIGGYRGIETGRSEGGHYIEGITITGVSNIGINILNNVKEMMVSDVTALNVHWGGIRTGSSSNVTINGATTDGGYYGYAISGVLADPGSNITLIECNLYNRSAVGPTYGLWMEWNIDNINVIGGNIENCQYGIYFNAHEDAMLKFEDFVTRNTVENAIYSIPSSAFSAEFVNCNLQSSAKTVFLSSALYPQRVELVNCSVSPLSAWDLTGDCIVNMSFYTNVEVQNGIGDPADVNLEIDHQDLGVVFDDQLPDGWLDKIPLQSVLIDETDMYKILHDFKAVSVLPSGSWVEMNDVWITKYDTVSLFLDLAPYNNFSTEIEFEEDKKFDVGLYDHFVDPEGEEFTWDISTGPEIVHHLIQGQKTLRLESAEENWHGTSWVYINATDAGGNWTDVNATVTVRSVNDPPVLLEDLPMLTTPEDTPVWINFSGRAEDDDGDTLTWSAEEIENCTLSWDDSGWNLTITPDDNWYGILEIPVKVSDGTVNPEWILTVDVTPVNDMPMVKVLWSNGTEADQVEYEWNETTNITAWKINTMEDIPVEFGFYYDDVETDEPASILIYSDLMHGALDLTVYQREEIINTTTNETAMVDYTIITNYTYTPDADDFAGDLIQFNISDGEEEVTLWIWFNVKSVNDRPVFDAPDDWNVTVELDNETVIDIGGWMSDVDGDALTISVNPDDYVTINGTKLEILYNDTFMGDHQNVTVTISDGTLTAGAVLLINITREVEPGDDDDDDDDDDEFNVTNPKVEATEDGWIITVEGEPGQTVYVAVVDDDGDVTYYEMDYEDGKYTVTIDKDDAEEGFEYYFTDSDGGDKLIDGGDLPHLKDKKDDPFPWWIVAVVLAILLVGVIILLILGRGAGSADYDEE
ncbi:MAG: Ig-like domain-containing protein [Thermoplasmatota archaeon]